MTSCGYFFISLPSKCKTPWSRFPERSILLIEQTRAVSGLNRRGQLAAQIGFAHGTIQSAAWKGRRRPEPATLTPTTKCPEIP